MFDARLYGAVLMRDCYAGFVMEQLPCFGLNHEEVIWLNLEVDDLIQSKQHDAPSHGE